MPEGCSTWPAFWSTTTGQWPSGGEIDIIEGVNDKGPNLSSLHTSPNCNMPDKGANRMMKGSAEFHLALPPPPLTVLGMSPLCGRILLIVSAQSVFLRSAVSNTCDASLNSNEGCGVSYTSQPTSFGPAFNTAGGGWYVLRRSPDSIATWFFPRASTNVPLDIRLGLPTLDESEWGLPDAEFPTAQGCTLEGDGGVMGDHELVFDLT